MNHHLKPAVAELTGTFVIVFASSGAIMADVIAGGVLGPIGIGTAFGVAVAVMILVFGPVSGAHFNPAISLVMMATRGLSATRTLVYVVAQILGGLLAAYVLAKLLGNVALVGTPEPNKEIATVAGIPPSVLIFALGFVFTALLLSVVLAVANKTRLEGPVAAFSVGAAVALAIVVSGPLVGSALNPARFLGPAAVTGTLRYIAPYMIAPIAGAFFGALLYRLIIDQPKGKRSRS